ncbi:MAG: ABC transporter permease [Bacteroidetes bacterium OLB9]|nr:MAG: ABC transporter permease [Bacteroidetes bacterium OLB9]
MLVPTLFFVLVAAFFLSKAVPGDQAESMMQLQGIRPESSNADSEYTRIYTELGLHLPTFYFSVLPDFYPDNVHAITDRIQREWTTDMLHQKVPSEYVEAFLESKNHFLQLAMMDTTQVWQKVVKIAKFENDIEILNSSLPMENEVDGDSLSVAYQQFALAVQDMKAQKRRWYFPAFRWHGTKNQFHQWIKKIALGDFGISIKDGRPVWTKMATALRWTILLAVLNLFFSMLIAVPVGLWAGHHIGSRFDKINKVVWMIIYAIPVFWLASLLIIYFTSDRYGAWMNIFPSPGLWYIPEGQSMWTTFSMYGSQLILPIICMVANDIALLSTMVRNNVAAEKSKLYVLMAYAKGLSQQQVLTKHILPNVLLPLITIAGSRLAAGLAGALIIEVIFNIPGMGRLMYDSIFAADWNVVFGILVVLSLLTILILLITDVLYAIADPRIKFQKS